MTVKVHALIRKLPHLTDAAFHAHWRDPHGTLTTRMRQIERYVQNHGVGPVAALPSLPAPEFQGVPAIWVAALSTLSEMFTDPNYAPLAADADLLYDSTQLVWLITHEQVIKSSPAQSAAHKPYKAMVFLKRRPDADTGAFAAALLEAATHLASTPQIESCIVCTPIEEAYPPPQRPAFEGIIETSFADRAELDRRWPAMVEHLRSSPLERLLEARAVRGFLAIEERAIWPEG